MQKLGNNLKNKQVHLGGFTMNSKRLLFSAILFFSFFTVLTPFASSQENYWQQLGGPNGATVKTIVVNKAGDIFAGMYHGGGIYRSTNNGDTWLSVSSGLVANDNVYALAFSKSGLLFAGMGQGIFMSSNNGGSWSARNSGLTNLTVHTLCFDSSGYLYAGTSNGIFRSVDLGLHWTDISNGLIDKNIWAFTVAPNGNFFAGTFQGGIFRSTNRGELWVQVNNGLTKFSIWSLAVNNKGKIFAGSMGGGAFSSSNDGNNWIQVLNPLGPDYCRVSALVCIDSNTVLAGVQDDATNQFRLYRSNDAGSTWVQSPTVPAFNVFSLAVKDSGFITAGTSGAGVFKSTDKGISWSKISIGINSSYVRTLATSSSGGIFAGLWGDGIYRSSGNINSWERIGGSNDFSRINSIAFDSSGVVFAGTQGNGVFRSSDNGGTWISTNTSIKSSSVMAMATTKTGRLYVATISGLFRSTDKGQTFSPSGINNSQTNTIAINQSGSVFIGTLTGEIFRSTNDGSSWVRVGTGLPGGSIISLAINSKGKIFAAVGGNNGSEVYSSIDNGQNWVKAGLPLGYPNTGKILITSLDHIYIATGSILLEQGGGVFCSVDDGTTWKTLISGLSNLSIWGITIDSAGHLLAGTMGGGVFRGGQSVLTTINENMTPQSFTLMQNYPNPFNPSTKIQFSLQKKASVDLYIYDIHGRLVRKLIDGQEFSVGMHDVEWDGRNNNSERVASGIYFSRIQAENYSATRKMVLLK